MQKIGIKNLEMKNKCPTKKLGDVLHYEQPTVYLVESTEYNDEYSTPVLTAGKSFIKGYTNETHGIFQADKLPVIIFDDFTTATQFVDFQFKVKSTAMKILVPSDELDISYAYYFMQTINHDHRTHKRYWISEYSKRDIPLPPLEEQKRIVKVLEKKLGNVKEAVQLRQDAIADTEKILSAKLTEVFIGGKEKGWEEKELGDIVEFQNGKAHEQHIKPESAFKVINSKFVSSNGVIYKESDQQLTPLIQNDVVMVMSDVPNGKTLAKCYLVESDNVYTLNQRIGCFRVKNNKELDARYLFIQLNRNEQLLSYDKGRGQTNLRKNDILEIKLPVPDLKTQAKIVKELDELSARVASLRALQETQLADLKSLERAYLHEAFNGELV